MENNNRDSTKSIQGNSVGMATMADDKTIILDLRAESSDGALGDARLMYPVGHPQYQEIFDHLGGLKPGEHKTVTPFNEEANPIGHFRGEASEIFSFDYPIFDHWAVTISERGIEYRPDAAVGIKLEHPLTVRIQVFNYGTLGRDEEAWKKSIPNRFGIRYLERTYTAAPGIPRATFYLDASEVLVTVPRGAAYPHFSGEIIWRTVVDSFQVVGIIREQALRVALADAARVYRDLSRYRVEAVQQPDGWHVDYEVLPPMNGGGPHYVIDAKTGAILSKRYEQ